MRVKYLSTIQNVGFLEGFVPSWKRNLTRGRDVKVASLLLEGHEF
jgi:hypothetical protein